MRFSLRKSRLLVFWEAIASSVGDLEVKKAFLLIYDFLITAGSKLT
jgi:hypothetical protein